MTDPEARRWLQKHEACPIAWFEHDGGFLRCNDHDSDSPTLAADLALAEKVREWGERLHRLVADDYHRGEAMKATAFRRDESDLWLAELLTACAAIIQTAEETSEYSHPALGEHEGRVG